MGWLTLSQGGNSATSQAPLPLAITPQLTSGQSVTIAASKADDNDPAGIVPSITSWNPASCASVFSSPAIVSNTPGSSPRATATTVFSLTDSTPPSSALTCTGTVSDQYGEPAVAFTVNVAAGRLSMATWPATLEVGAGGMTLGQSGSTLAAYEPPHLGLLALLTARVSPFINTALGGGTAVAGQCVGGVPISPMGGCYSTPSPGPLTTPTPASLSVTPGPCYGRAVTALGSTTPDTTIPTSVLNLFNLGIDPSGCIMYDNGTDWVPATTAQIGAIVYEPSETAKTFGIKTNTCTTNTAAVGLWNPGYNNEVQALLNITGGSSGGTCAVTLTDGTTTQNVGPDTGQVTVSTLGPCVNNGMLAINASCILPPDGGSNQCYPTWPNGTNGSNGYTATLAYYLVINGPGNGTFSGNPTTGIIFTRTSAGSVTVQDKLDYTPEYASSKCKQGTTTLVVGNNTLTFQ